jgi:putative tryptophan/tyrosine transport system substrate-binding protein
MTDRRSFLRTASSALAAIGVDAFAQAAGRQYRVGVLRPTGAPRKPDPVQTEVLLPAMLAEMGYVEGRNLTFDLKYAGGDLTRLPALARELVDKPVDVIVAVGGAAVRAAMTATSSIPIIVWGNFDPVAEGFVASLARPGRNVTAVLISAEGTFGAKKLELLKEAVPSARRIAVLAPEDPTGTKTQLPELQQAASRLSLDVSVFAVSGGDLAGAFARIVAGKADAIFILADTYFMIDRHPVIAQTLQARLPAIWEWREQVIDGGLMSYGTSYKSRIERIADYIGRVLKGNSPSDIPVDLPTKFGLTLNLATAKAIGLKMPQSLMLRADEVIR